MSPESPNVTAMKVYRNIVDIICETVDPDIPDGLEPAIKFTKPDWTTYGGFSWWQPGRKWIESPDGFNPITCRAGGLHVANTVAAAQSGGGLYHACLLVALDPGESGPWEWGKRKAKRVRLIQPVDLLGVLRLNGRRADLREAMLEGADLGGADLRGADLWGADLWRANLGGAILEGADLGGADLRRAILRGADLGGADLRGAILRGAILEGADLRGADLREANLWRAILWGAKLWGADLRGADLRGADLRGAILRGDWDDLVARGAIR